jgi:hypothetical protein
MVWIIGIYYLVAVGFVLSGFALIWLGLLPLSPEAGQYYSSLHMGDWLVSCAIVVCNALAAVLLLMQRRQAFHLYLAGLGMTLVQAIFHAASKGWIEVLGGAGVVGASFGFLISLGAVTYAYWLNRTGKTR